MGTVGQNWEKRPKLPFLWCTVPESLAEMTHETREAAQKSWPRRLRLRMLLHSHDNRDQAGWWKTTWKKPGVSHMIDHRVPRLKEWEFPEVYSLLPPNLGSPLAALLMYSIVRAGKSVHRFEEEHKLQFSMETRWMKKWHSWRHSLPVWSTEVAGMKRLPEQFIH